MSHLEQSLDDLLQELEARTDAFDIDDAHSMVSAYAKAHPEQSLEQDKTAKAELVALGLFAGSEAETGPWGTHFGPLWAVHGTDYPPLTAVTTDMVAYWKTRARACKHPRLRSRYADAAWDLEPTVANGTGDHEMAAMAIDAYVADCGCAGIDICQVEGLNRALHVALKLGDGARVASVRDAILAFQKKVADPEKPRLVLFHFDALYERRKKVKLSEVQLQDMAAGLEKQLAEWSDPSDKHFDPLSARELAQRLVQYYNAANRAEDVKRVINVYARGKLHIIHEANGLMSHHWLEELHQDYLAAGMRADADALIGDIKKASERMVAEMRPMSVSVPMSKEEMEAFCNGITKGDVDTAVRRIVSTFTPDVEKLRKQMHEIAAAHPFAAMVPTTFVDTFTRARVGSIHEDEPGRLVLHTTQYMALESLFLRQAFNRLVQRYDLTAENLVELLYRSELFDAERKALFVMGVKSVLADDHVACVHILIPQIEHLLRRLLDTIGGITTNFDHESRTYREKDLGTVLRDPAMDQFWKEVAGNDIALYFRVVLTDQRGFNVRNRVCHGLCKPEWFASYLTDRLLHILMLLSYVRLTRTSGVDSTPNELTTEKGSE